jgi:hypothetical protein
MYTLWEYLTLTKGVTYFVAFALMVGFVPFFLYLTNREK